MMYARVTHIRPNNFYCVQILAQHVQSFGMNAAITAKPTSFVQTFVLTRVHEPIMFHFMFLVALESLSNVLFCTICFSKCMCPTADMYVCCGWEGSVLGVDGKETAISKRTNIATQ